jgi:hypothetical protein
MRNVSYWRAEDNPVSIRWMDTEYDNAAEYYHEVVMTMPKTDGIILGAETHIDALARLSGCGLYVVDTDKADVYVDDWRVNGSSLTHRHPEFGPVASGWTEGYVEAEVCLGACDICEKQIPGEIDMMHQFYRLNG